MNARDRLSHLAHAERVAYQHAPGATTRAGVFAPVRQALNELAESEILVRKAPDVEQWSPLQFCVGTTNLATLPKSLRDRLAYTSVRVCYTSRGKSAGWVLDVSTRYTITIKRIREPALYPVTWEFSTAEAALEHLLSEIAKVMV